jgi:hypothetical protein
MGGCLMAERLLKHGKKTNDSTYNGQVYFMKGTDTIHTEKILLQQVERIKLNTAIKVKMTMNQYPLYLRIEMKRNLFFENRKHNYPQKSATRRFQKTVW